jgi:hypothetical protein
MRINLNQNEIFQALREYVETQGIPLAGKSVEVTLIAGRGANGHKAAVAISKLQDEPAPEVAEDDTPTAPAEEEQEIAFNFDGED